MTQKPSFALHVSTVSITSAFLTEKLGFTLLETSPNEDIAYILDSDGDTLLLAGPKTNDVSSYLASPHFIPSPGGHFKFSINNLEARQAELLSKGVTDFQVIQSRIGDQVIYVPIPDGYSFRFILHAPHSFAELLDIYTHLPMDLDKALAGLNESNIGLALNADNWNIRQIVHHIADTDIFYSQTMKVALSSPGTKMDLPPTVGNENVSHGHEYRDRPIASSLTLSHSMHKHIQDIASYIPEAGEHFIEQSNGNKQTFSQLVRIIVRHGYEHIDEIWAIRYKHGL